MVWVWEYCRGASRQLEYLGIEIMRSVLGGVSRVYPMRDSRGGPLCFVDVVPISGRVYGGLSTVGVS